MEERDLPVGWVVAPIAELATKVGSGATPKGGQSAYQITGTPLIRSMNVVFFGFKEEGLAYINDDQAQLLSNAEVRQGDVLLNITGASIGRVTAAPDWSEGARVNQHVCIIRPSGCLLQSYLSAYLSSPAIQSLILDENYGVTRQALTKQQVLELEIPVPPLNEQHRIAAKLDVTLAAVDACRQRLDGVAAILKRFRQAVLAAATSGELTREWREESQIESDWVSMELSGICLSIADGDHQAPPKADAGIPFITISAINDAVLRVDRATRYVPESYYDGLGEARKAREDDILFSVTGSVAIPALVDSPQRFVFQRHIALLRPNSDVVLPQFLYFRLLSDDVKRQCLKVATGTAQLTVSLGSLRAMSFRIPSLQEQAEINKRTQHLFTLADQLEARLTTARKVVDRLTPALLAKAFRGELVPQDPNDEPANVLLERIRAARQVGAGAGKSSGRGRKKAAALPDQLHLDAVPVPPDLLSGLLRECGALSERALLAASELDAGRFRRQLEHELKAGSIRDTNEEGKSLLEAVEAP